MERNDEPRLAVLIDADNTAAREAGAISRYRTPSQRSRARSGKL